MVAEAEARRVEFKSEDRDFWSRYHEYRRLRHKESRPDDPLRPDDVEEALLKRDSPFDIHHHHEVVQDGRLVSWFSGSTSKPGTPGHESNKHLFWAYIYVRPEARRRGIGSSWLPLLVELMDAHGCTVAGFGTEEASGHAFLNWLGAEAKFSGAENRLKLADVDWKMVDRWIVEGPQRSPETKLESYEGPLPEAMWADYAPQLSSLLNTMPFENLDFGQIVLTPDHMRDYYARLEIGHDQLHTILTREPSGVISAITDTSWAPHRPTVIEQRFTGVRPDARGRGLGKWIKAAMLAHVHELHPQAEWVTTENAGSNAPMLAINKKLGFKEFRAATEYQIGRDNLAVLIQRLPARRR
ncbi:MAG TPA: GNAT family N-acetyltransferase [Candidatus Dormibacteraeota bacterium]|jgi:GNAT superfamily N-acetyltransferase|nr:GNAT family N-acetyltransferase [Candidatus Dormibacteraeota bacterium]